MPEQYLAWLKEALQGNFGQSLSYKQPAMPMLTKRLPDTILLMGASLFVSLVVSIPLGLIAGYKKNTWIDNAISAFAYFGMSIPSFYFGMLMIILFTAKLHILPSSGMHTVGVNTPWDTFLHMIMPVSTMALSSMASKVRHVRANTIGQLSDEYVLAAKAKGTSGLTILFRHVLKNTLLPIITIVGMNMASLVCGSFIIESVFGWPGIGTFAMEAIGKRDYPIIMAYIMLSGFILVMGNFVADILYSFADPRIKRGVDAANGK
jgi:peptide/nickel transport system permease protein